jgi:hypothetical protein
MAGHRTSVRRFASAEIDTSRSTGLKADHPALSEGRTIFPTTVSSSKASPRFLVSGHNNPKLGKAVLKGPRTGWPIYQLSLEERATCPRTCAQWADCYGNAMPFARRHTPDVDFERFLVAEIITLCRAHPEGLLVRLHALGDFYSVEYVYIWARLITDFPQLHVFGYTARKVDDADPDSARIARAIYLLTESAWDRFSIRTSGVSTARSRSVVVDENPMLADTIVCPAQTSDTEACASCGLCWASAARDKTIAFLRHGMKTRGPKAANDVVAVPAAKIVAVAAPAPKAPPATKAPATDRPLSPGCAKAFAYLTDAADADGKVSATWAEICKGSGVPSGSMGYTMETLVKRGVISIAIKGNGRGDPVTYQIGKTSAAPVTAAPAATRPAYVSPIKLTTKVTPRMVTRGPAAPSADDLSDIPANDAKPRGLVARKAGQCAYPTNSPAIGRGEDTTFCCEPSVGRLSYCKEHTALMFSRPAKKVAA